MPQFYTLLTDTGQAKLANAVALGGTIEITELAVGDGGGSLPAPDSNASSLVNEVRRAAINASQTDPDNPSWIVVEQVLPPDVGGWTIREIGIYDTDGDLIGIGNYPETYKPVLAEGSSRTQTVRFVLEVSDTSAVTLKVDPSVVLATRQLVDDKIAEHAESRDHPAATETEQGMVIKASQSEVDAGGNDTKFVTAKKLKHWAANWVKQATETVAGMLKVATQDQVEEGEDDKTAVTPKKLRWGFDHHFDSMAGYIAFPSYLAGFIIQWKRPVVDSGGSRISWPISFSNKAMMAVACEYGSNNLDPLRVNSFDNNGLTLEKTTGSQSDNVCLIGVGH